MVAGTLVGGWLGPGPTIRPVIGLLGDAWRVPLCLMRSAYCLLLTAYHPRYGARASGLGHYAWKGEGDRVLPFCKYICRFGVKVGHGLGSILENVDLWVVLGVE